MFSFFENKKPNTYAPEYQAYLTFFDKKQDIRLPVRVARFVVLDTETTGLDYKKDRILSIAAIEVKDFGFSVKDRMVYFLKQSSYQPKDSIAVHGISQKTTIEGIDKKAALAELLDFVKNDIIVGHNIGFDMAILNETLKRKMDGSLKNKVLDTSMLARRIERVFL